MKPWYRWTREFSSLAAVLVLVCGAATGQTAADAPGIRVETFTETAPVSPGKVKAAVAVDLGEGWHVNAHKPLDEFLIPTTLTFQASSGIEAAETAYPDPQTLTFEATGDTLAVYGPAFVIGVLLDVPELPAGTEVTLEGTLRYQACDSKQCLPPKTLPVSLSLKIAAPSETRVLQRESVFAKLRFSEASGMDKADLAVPESESNPLAGETAQSALSMATQFQVAARAAGYLDTRDFLAFLDRAESGSGGAEENPLGDKSWWFVIAIVLTGGMLLNLTPCVLPLIPINLAIIGAGAKAGSRARGFARGGAYGLGIALTYGALGLVVVLGFSTTFGAINATPWFNAIMVVVFVGLALALFDVYLIDFTRYQSKLRLKRTEGGGFFVAFVMGSVSALLAGACVAPVIISTIVYAQDQYAKGETVALLLPFLLGLGMALPWPLAGAGLSFLPKPGKWMTRVKYAFGVFVLVLAAYYGHLAYTLFSDRYLTRPETVTASMHEMDKEGWIPSLAQGLDQARREGKPVLIDFWATWCKNCLAMNQTTFKQPEVTTSLERYVKIKFQAEDPAHPATQEVLTHFGVVGLPTYVVLEPERAP